MSGDRWGVVDKLQMKRGDHSIYFDADRQVSHKLLGADFGAEGGYLLIRFDVDEEPYSVVHVESPVAWWPTPDKAPHDLVRRAAEYLTALSNMLETIERLAREETERQSA
jgi:hypothetical protein